MRICLIALLLLTSAFAKADDRQDLTQLLNQFLANAHVKAMHQRFWADDLIYTSSTGERFGKAKILAGFKDDAAQEVPTSRYSAEDIDIRLLGDVAVVVFTLVGKTGDALQRYYNTGTFVKRAGQWQALAWSATKIPAEKP